MLMPRLRLRSIAGFCLPGRRLPGQRLTALLLAALLLIGLADRAAADARSGVVERAPGAACLAVYSGDVGRTCEAFLKTTLGQRLSSPDFEPLIKELGRLDMAGPLRPQPALGLSWSDLATVHEPGGLVIFPLADNKMGVAWLFVAPKGATPPPALAAAEKYFKAKGYLAKKAEQSGVSLTVLDPPAAQKTGTTRVLFVAADYYGVANSRAAADALVGTSVEKSLAKDATFIKQLATSGADKAAKTSDVSFYLRPIELWELNRAATPAEKKPAAAKQVAKAPVSDKSKSPKAKPAEKAKVGDKSKATVKADAKPKRAKPAPEDELAATKRLGWDGLQAAGGLVTLDATSVCQWEIKAALLAPRPYRGAMRLLAFTPGQLAEPPNWISANAVSIGAWRWSFGQAIQGYGTLFDQANEPGPDGQGLFEDMLDGLRDDPEGVQVDLRRDLFGQTAADALRVTLPKPAGAAEKSDDPWLFVVGLNDEKTVKSALTKFYKDDKRVQHTTQGPFDVWTVGEGASLFVEGESESVVSVRALAVGRRQLMFGTDAGLLAPAMEGKPSGAGLTSDASWKALLGWIKPQQTRTTAAEGLVRLADRLQAPYQPATTKPPSDDDGPGAGLWRLLLFGTNQGENLPLSAAPKFDRVQAGLPQGATVLSQTEDGWLIRFGALAPTKP